MTPPCQFGPQLDLGGRGDYVAHQPVFLGRFGGHPEILVGVFLDLFEALAGLRRNHPVQMLKG